MLENVKMPARCVVAGCSNTPNSAKGITLHTIPYFGDDRPSAKSRRKQWIDFVKTKRANFTPSSSSAVCSMHFSPEDYTQRFNLGERCHPQLIRDELGIVPIPKIFSKTKDGDAQSCKTISYRSRRRG